MQKSIYSKGYIELTKWLKQNREVQKLTIRDLAKILEVHHPVIWNIENCNRRLDIMEYMNYCEKLNLDPLEGIRLIKQSYIFDKM